MEKRYLRLRDKRELNPSGSLIQMHFDAHGLNACPGQFVNIAVEGKYLRRPISVSEYDGETLTLIVARIGEGTVKLTDTPVGEHIEMLTDLGNTFTLRPEAKRLMIIGGGVGYAPLVGLLDRLSAKEYDIRAFFGFNSGTETPLRHLWEMGERYEENLIISTMTGDYGVKGNAVETALGYCDETGFRPEYFYTCGPMPMMNAVSGSFDIPGEMSMEARMGCGFGACMGCTVQTPEGPKRICKEGPVFMVKK